jgi:hypothetical protein
MTGRSARRKILSGAARKWTSPMRNGGCCWLSVLTPTTIRPGQCMLVAATVKATSTAPCVSSRWRAERRADALIDSVAKETALRDLALSPGQFVTTWHGARVGLVVKVNKVTVKVRLIGGQGDRRAVVEKNLDPRYVGIASASLSSPPKPGDMVLLRDHSGRTREARVVAVDDPLFEATYSLKAGQWRSAWFDLAAIQPGAGPS